MDERVKNNTSMEISGENSPHGSNKRSRSCPPHRPANRDNHITCRACHKTYPWPAGSHAELRLYRVMCLNEDTKSFFCDADCYYNDKTRRAGPTSSHSADAETLDEAMETDPGAYRPFPASEDKHYLSLYNLGGSGIDWDAKKLRNPQSPRTQSSIWSGSVEGESGAMEDVVPQ